MTTPQLITSFPERGSNRVEPRHPLYVAAQDAPGRIYINPSQYIEGVPPEVWEFEIGGYQVLEKWLKDRRGRQLSWSEIQNYQRIVVALRESQRLIAEIDEIVPEWPLV